jgi:hypothetical protein
MVKMTMLFSGLCYRKQIAEFRCGHTVSIFRESGLLPAFGNTAVVVLTLHWMRQAAYRLTAAGTTLYECWLRAQLIPSWPFASLLIKKHKQVYPFSLLLIRSLGLDHNHRFWKLLKLYQRSEVISPALSGRDESVRDTGTSKSKKSYGRTRGEGGQDREKAREPTGEGRVPQLG